MAGLGAVNEESAVVGGSDDVGVAVGEAGRLVVLRQVGICSRVVRGDMTAVV